MALSVNLLISVVLALLIVFLLENKQASEIIERIYKSYLVTGFKSILEIISKLLDYNNKTKSPRVFKIGRYVVNVTYCFITEYKKDSKVNQFFYKNI